MRELLARKSAGPFYARPWFSLLVGASCLAVGLLAGRAFFPLEVSKLILVEKRVEVPVVRVVEKRVEVPVGKVDRLDSLETKSASARRVWPEIREGLSRSEVREMLGSPGVIDDHYGVWYYANSGWVRFDDGVVSAWKEPSR